MNRNGGTKYCDRVMADIDEVQYFVAEEHFGIPVFKSSDLNNMKNYFIGIHFGKAGLKKEQKTPITKWSSEK